MKDLINRVQQQLNNNHAVEADDIQALVDYVFDHIKEAKGSYKKETKFIWQIKHKSRTYYDDNADSNMFDNGMEGLEKWIENNNTEYLKTRIIKRTVKEDLIRQID